MILKYFHTLGPSDARVINPDLTFGAVDAKSARFPRPPTYPDRLYTSALITRIGEITGVAGVFIELPTDTITVTPGALIVPGTIEVRIGV